MTVQNVDIGIHPNCPAWLLAPQAEFKGVMYEIQLIRLQEKLFLLYTELVSWHPCPLCVLLSNSLFTGQASHTLIFMQTSSYSEPFGSPATNRHHSMLMITWTAKMVAEILINNMKKNTKKIPRGAFSCLQYYVLLCTYYHILLCTVWYCLRNVNGPVISLFA